MLGEISEMKKYVSMMLILALSVSCLTGCGNKTTEAETASEVETQQKEETVKEESKETSAKDNSDEAIGVQTITGYNNGIQFTITYDGDVLLLKNGDELSDVNSVRFTSLEDKSRMWVSTDELNFSQNNNLSRFYDDNIEHYKEFDSTVKNSDGTTYQWTYTTVTPTEFMDKTIAGISGKYYNIYLVDSQGEITTRHYFSFLYDDNHYTEISYEATTDEQSANFEKLVEAVTIEITCEGMYPGNINGVVNAGMEKNINTVQLLYNDGASVMEISYNQDIVHIDEYFLSEPQQELEVIYDNIWDDNDAFYRYVFYTDNENYTSVDDFYQINVNDCKKMFSDAVATELKEIPCGNITFYTFTMNYTDNQNNAVTAPLYFAEIEPGVYIYVNLGDTIQSNNVDETKLKIDEQMIKELFLNVDMVQK